MRLTRTLLKLCTSTEANNCSVLRLLDAGDCEAELEGTQLFYLGLQMGLELGRLNLWNQS